RRDADDGLTRRHRLRHHRAGARLAPRAKLDRGDEHRVAPQKHAVTDDRAVLPLAIVIAGNRPGPDVDASAERRVSQVAEVPNPRAPPNRRRLGLHVVPNVHAGLDLRARPHVRIGTDMDAVPDLRAGQPRMHDLRVLAYPAVLQHTVVSEPRSRAYPGVPTQYRSRIDQH